MKITRDMVIFSLVGIFNTVFDIALYTVLDEVTHNIVIANIVSTSIALLVSYILNSKYAFKSETDLTKLISFLAVTAFGLWVVQTVAIYVINRSLISLIPNSLWDSLGSLASAAKIILPKLLATGVSLVWNYLWYSRVIFKKTATKPLASL